MLAFEVDECIRLAYRRGYYKAFDQFREVLPYGLDFPKPDSEVTADEIEEIKGEVAYDDSCRSCY
jgi:hypothetical protein